MSLDIKYRPNTYSDVLGQEATIAVLKQYVASGKGFEQSYLFCGGFGSGKTTLGRILARALLCEHPVNGEPCDQCFSCLSMQDDKSSLDFIEVDAATNSGKADINRIKEDIEYNTFSGRQRLYLFDEAHQLSKDALDALLKPLEDNVPGTSNKKLVCIFCTTEPERMRATVLSRCAPAFIIAPQTSENIASRLAFICKQEGITYEDDALMLIADMTESHIRDALKAVEGVSMLGAVTRENVASYLHLDTSAAYLDILEELGTDLAAVLESGRQVLGQVSPIMCYERCSDAAMAAFRAFMGVKITSHWDPARLQKIGSKQGSRLLTFAQLLANRPGRPTPSMFLCDLSVLHYGGNVAFAPAHAYVPAPVAQVQAAPAVTQVAVPVAVPPARQNTRTPQETNPRGIVTDEWFVDQRAVAKTDTTALETPSYQMDPKQFVELLAKTLLESSLRGQTRRAFLGSA